MSTQYQKLLSLLKELFQTDQAELDFGMYRVINQRRDEINRFLDEELLPQVKTAFSEYQSVDKKSLEVELAEATKGAEKLGVDPDTVPKVQEIREQLATYSVDVDDLENQVYSALFNFFRRYYNKGDFISQRRYKEGVYAIPYEGEEVKLHWANHDQYYIKTSEYLRDYTFKLSSGKLAHFKLVEADTEKDNRKEADDKKRRFILAEEPLAIENGELAIHFEFRPDDEKRAQKKLNEQAVETIIGLREHVGEQTFKDALAELAVLAPNEKNINRTLLAKHLGDYTRRNTQDYFIHKDLGKFLRRELDFFIKNEIMHLDNIENETAPKVEQYLSKIKVIRNIAHKLIDFLAQIEEFQKKLWLKKKFVVETHYCVTLDRVPEELYPAIAKNDAQREEWVKLFAIDEIEGDMFAVAYSNPLTIEFLKANPFLLVDTIFFNAGFNYCLLASFKDLNEELDGLLIHSENFQVLNLIKARYRRKCDYIYIDPPYNTDSAPILYKNGYKDSSWLSLISDRVKVAKDFLSNKGTFTLTIDDFENANVQKVISQSLNDYDLYPIVIEYNHRGRSQNNFAVTHEYALWAVPTGQDIITRKAEISEEIRRNLRRTGTASRRADSPTQFFGIEVNNETREIIRVTEALDIYADIPKHNNSSTTMVWPIDDDEVERRWYYGKDRVRKEAKEGTVWAKRINKRIQIHYWQAGKQKRRKTVWVGSELDASTFGSELLNAMFFQSPFSYPKSIYAVNRCVKAASFHNSIQVMDFFAGSGSTGHAVININREDNGKRKYILVEMGQYFYTVTKPRIQKAIYSEDWKDGKPVSRKGSSHAFKYIKLESYEDTLNNLELKRTEEQGQALLGAEAFREDYLLSYMLDIESKDSLLDIKIFETPFDYQLKIASSTVGETTPTKVDLVETFNYLIGLRVHTVRKVDGVVLVEGQTQQSKKVLVIWRNINELDNDKLKAFFTEHFVEQQREFDIIYVNGDNTLANIRPKGATWQVHLIEKEFHFRMFEEG
jgi:adenine-specific DNA-methyltransferase